jgi:lipopolysaccharide transport system ATP-binding protein
MSTGDWSIRAEGISKKFGLSLRQSMRYGLGDIASRLLGGASGTSVLRKDEFWAVQDVSFELREGIALGIMGVNGSGKTTLLRMLNGVYAPDSGRVALRGRVGSLIAAGAGFAPTLSGRENVYVNGALLGLTPREIAALMDEIVAFAELGQFIDLPVKNYSSGMHVRLGFAIAALSRPDILLMDEILAVGDMNFQKKCFDHILQLKRQGTSIILVSHAPGAIWSVCERALFMDHGKVLLDGSVEDVIRAYEDQNARNAVASGEQFDRAQAAHAGSDDAEELKAEYGHAKGGTGDAICTGVRLLGWEDGGPRETFAFGEPMQIEADIEVRIDQQDLLLRFTVDAAHYRFIATLDSYEQGLDLASVRKGAYRLRVRILRQNFRPGAYALNVGISRKSLGLHLFYWHAAARYQIEHPRNRFLYSDSNAVMHLDCEFDLVGVAAASPAVSSI